jgi:hypothetical protein
MDPHNFMCGICREPLREATTPGGQCGHMYCRACISQVVSRKCPECRGKLLPLIASPFVDRLMVNMPDQCPEEKCAWTGTREEREVHWRTCPERMVACPQCHEEVYQLHQHLQTQCLQRIVPCPECTQQIAFQTMDTHMLNDCPEACVTCPNPLHDIPVPVRRREQDDHDLHRCPAMCPWVAHCESEPFANTQELAYHLKNECTVSCTTCQVEVPVSELSEHHNLVCPGVLMACSMLGCYEWFPRRDMLKHLQSFSLVHEEVNHQFMTQMLDILQPCIYRSVRYDSSEHVLLLLQKMGRITPSTALLAVFLRNENSYKLIVQLLSTVDNVNVMDVNGRNVLQSERQKFKYPQEIHNVAMRAGVTCPNMGVEWNRYSEFQTIDQPAHVLSFTFPVVGTRRVRLRASETWHCMKVTAPESDGKQSYELIMGRGHATVQLATDVVVHVGPLQLLQLTPDPLKAGGWTPTVLD